MPSLHQFVRCQDVFILMGHRAKIKRGLKIEHTCLMNHTYTPLAIIVYYLVCQISRKKQRKIDRGNVKKKDIKRNKVRCREREIPRI